MAHDVLGTCSLDCPDACAWVVTVEDDTPVKLRGNPDHPYTRGGLCTKVNPYLAWSESDHRILHPLRRIGAKGEGRFERVSWETALEEIARRMRNTIDEFGGEAIWPFAGTGTVGHLQGEYAGSRLFNVLGASDHLLNICSLAGRLGMEYTMGSPFGMLPTDLVHSSLILLWGTNTLTSNQHLWPFIQETQGRGAEVVVIDPFRTRTAARADHHIAPLPGTDGALALGVVAELVHLGATDPDFLSTHTHGWDRFVAEGLAGWDGANADAACGLEPGTTRWLAERIATNRPTGIRTSMGVQRHAGGGQATRLLSMIPAVTGDFDRLGGGITYSTGSLYGLDTAARRRVGLRPGPVRTLTMTRLGDALLGDLDPPVKVLFAWAANPAVSNPQTAKVRRGLARHDLFTVAVEHVHTETTRWADIVLPGTTQIEHAELQDSYGHHFLHWNEPAVAPRGEARSHTDLFRDLARAMGIDHPAVLASDDELAADLLGSSPALRGITLEALRERGWMEIDLPAGPVTHSTGFTTPSGRFEFASERAEADGHGLLPHWIPPAEAAEGDGVALVSPANQHLVNSTFAGAPTHTKAGEATLTIHPADAAGIANGSRVRAWNQRGSFEAVARVSDDARPGVAHVTKGNSEVNETVEERDADMGQGAVYHDNRVVVEPL
ncbi:MAG: molybdopterin-dependent oxidoreductase [Acidimicrobiia bacterium]|nr:molybdopterin-dependent oxidoreductase [Acidimicrobiia bacterium]